MPEKWESELRKLRSVERPSTLEDRVAEGPRHEPGRPTRGRVAAAVVAFAVCAAVGVLGYRTIANDDPQGRRAGSGPGVVSTQGSLIIELSSDADGPTATVRFADREQRAVFEGANWCPDGTTSGANCTSYIADFAFYPPVSEFLVVPPSIAIEVLGPATVAEVHVTDPSGAPSAVAEDLAMTPTTDGMYVYDVHAEWPQGTGDFFFGVQVLSDPSAAPDVLTVDCTSSVARVDTAVVRTQTDGLDVHVVGDTDGFSIGVPGPDGTGDPTSSAIGRTDQGSVPLPPGRWGITCGRDATNGSLLTPFELVDPDDHYAPTELVCGAVPQTAFGSNVPTATPHPDAIEQLLWGLAEGDRIRGAGYGAETWHLGFTYVVDRGGEAAARVVLAEQGGVWTGTFETCGDSGITLSQAIVWTAGGGTGPATTVSGATGPTDGTGAVDAPSVDTLVVRCEGLGPAVDVPSVVLQRDGLHVEATNVADASFVRVEADDGTPVPETIVFKHVTMRMIVDIEPGTYWVGCIPSMNGGVDETPAPRAEAPGLYVPFEVVPAG